MTNREALLESVVSQLRLFERSALVHVRVRLFQGSEMVKEFLGLVPALDALVNNMFWDEEGNWREADSAMVDTY